MNSSDLRCWLWTVGLLLCAACAGGPGAEHDPRPARVIPLGGANTQPVAVIIEGENFLALATQNLGRGAPVEVHSGFQARLGDTPLEDVVLEDERRLRAVVPAGLAPGWHALTVVSPLGRTVVLPEAYFSSTRTLSRLEARASLEHPTLVVGQQARLVLEVTNGGQTPALGVAPGLDVTGGGGVMVVAEPSPEDVAPGQQVSFTWTLRADVAGEVRLAPRARGQDAAMLRPVEPVVAPIALPLRAPAMLTAQVVLGAERVSLGQEVSVGLEVHNPGESLARAVTPSATVFGGASLLSSPEPADLAADERRTFSWRYRADSAGTLVFSLSATGTEAVTGAALAVAPLKSPPLVVQRAAALSATLRAPSHISVEQVVPFTLEVSNTGEATALNVSPVLGVPESGLEVLSRPAPADVAGGARHTFTWSLRATVPGAVTLEAKASGTDANSEQALATPTLQGSMTAQMAGTGTVTQLAADPLGDGTAFSFVLGYGGRLYLGPNRTGRGGVRMAPDGSGAESFTWRLPADTVGNRTANARPPPYFSLGATGCLKDSADCGPDNENGRGLLLSGVTGGHEWLGAVGANSEGDIDYLYLTQETDAQLDFRYVDLDEAPLGGQTRGASSALFFKDRLYLGFSDTGGNRPYLVVLKRTPAVAPGLDARPPDDVVSLNAETMPGLGSGGTPSNPASTQMIDALAAFNDRLYVANNGGCMRSTTPTPGPHDDFPGDWAPCTPALPAWTNRVSRTTWKTADLEPRDKAVPQLAAFGGRLYLARNTFTGPQLFVCTPGTGGDATQCDPGDWALVAPNTREDRDSLLTQFDNAANTSLALLVATGNHLYVGFNNTRDGLVLLRSEGTSPTTQADFRGAANCPASQHVSTCAGLGGNGLGVGATRLFDGVALGVNGASFVYVTAGDGSGAVRLFRVED